MPKFNDLTNQTFGRLTAIETLHKNKRGQWLWSCKCECGNPHVALGIELKRGGTKSCGCLRKEASRERMKQRHAK